MYNNNNDKYSPTWFKDCDFKNHILNEHNIEITPTFIYDLFAKYNFNHTIQYLYNFQTAMTHVSYLKKSMIKTITALELKNIVPISYELKKTVVQLQSKDYNTFEFLGDAVIHLALTEYLYKRYYKKDQGFLTKLRTKLEKSDTFSFLAKQLNLHRYVLIAKNMELKGARELDKKLTEDIFESFICALFMESSYDDCMKFIVSVIEKEIDLAELIHTEDNFKEKIMHYFNKMKWKFPKYIESKLTKKNKSDVNNQLFVIYVQNQEGETLGVGKGNIKSVAEQNAAHDALIKLGVLRINEDDIELGYYGIEENKKENKIVDEDIYEYESDNDNIDYVAWFKDGDFLNHIFNEKNITVPKQFIDDIFVKYNFNHRAINYDNYVLSMVHISYLEKTILRDKTAMLLKDVVPITKEERHRALPLQKKDNSRLGHLGNAVIHLAFTEYLYKRYPTKDQGFLTKIRTRMERGDTLSNLAKHFGFHKYAIVARNMEQNDGRLVDINLTKGIFEAFIGSIFLESNYTTCYAFLKILIEKEMDMAELLDTDDNYKGKLMQECHKLYGKDPIYEDVICDIEAKIFVVCVKNIRGEILGKGDGNTKSKAEQESAKQALIGLNIINNNHDDDDYYGEE